MNKGISSGLLVIGVAMAFGCGTGRKSQWETATTPAAVPWRRPPAQPPGTRGPGRGGLGQPGRPGPAGAGHRPLGGAPGRAARRRRHPGPAGARLLPAGRRPPARRWGPRTSATWAAFEKGIAAGERALAAVSPEFKSQVTRDEKVEEAIQVVGKEGLPAMYWYAVNLGKWSRAKGIAALLGNKDRVKGVLERVLALDETFFHGAPHRYFGVYWSLLPVGRDLDKSQQHFERSLAIAPNYVGTKVLMAESYAVKKQDRALFARLLDEVLATPDDDHPRPGARDAHREGQGARAEGQDRRAVLTCWRQRTCATRAAGRRRGRPLAAAVGVARASARAADAPITLKLATIAPEGTPWAEQVADYKAKVEGESKGRLRIKPFLGGGAGRREPDRGRVPARGHRHVGRHHRGAGHVGARDLGAGAALPVPRAEEADHVLDEVAARGAAQAAGGARLRAGAVVGERLPLVRHQVGAGQGARRSQGPQDALAGEPGAPRDLPGAGGAAPADRRHRGAAGAADRGGRRLRQHAASTPSPPPGTWPSSTSPCPSTSTSRARCWSSKKEFDKLPADLQKILTGGLDEITRKGAGGHARDGAAAGGELHQRQDPRPPPQRRRARGLRQGHRGRCGTNT